MYYIAAYDTEIKNTVDVYKKEINAELFDEANNNVKLVELVTNAATYFKQSNKVNTKTSIQLVVVNENRKILYRAPENIPLINMVNDSESDLTERIKLFAFTAKTDTTLFKNKTDITPIDEKPSVGSTESIEKPVEDTTTETKDTEVSIDTEYEIKTEVVVEQNTGSSTIIKLGIAVVAIAIIIYMLI